MVTLTTFTVLLWLHFMSSYECVYLQNVYCGTYPNYVETDLQSSSRYFPCMVQVGASLVYTVKRDRDNIYLA